MSGKRAGDILGYVGNRAALRTRADVRDILVQDSSIVVWWGTRTECISALARRTREGGLTLANERAARQVLHTLMETWTEMLPSDALRNTAERLLSVHPVRIADAFQLAAAIMWCRGQTVGQGFITFDRRLRDVGYREGFHILPDVF